ncbi:MAG: hypothetical protein GX804_09065 [Lentisphaerae bacterium]|nr:hypothetical protein [Lentisphaerota bacterium]
MSIAPCWVASPLSVSQLLHGNNQFFDMVIFDEASQILQEEAIPALYRANQVVVAGDKHQLPPTTFFATAIEENDDLDFSDGDNDKTIVTESIGGFESLLDTLEAFLPKWSLDWHYRSEDERLITFSNTYVYSNRLITFPSVHNREAISYVQIPHDPSLGGQEESTSLEVKEVVRQVLSHAEKRSNESLGVITMGIKHANRIQAALDRKLNSHPELSNFFSLSREERFFIKNLETVQGDERDAIILSIGYGKTASGDLPHRFGPLTQDVGYRRLNVAITRAKKRMCVISSFSHNDIDSNRSKSRGVQLLKKYLEYVASGGRQLPELEKFGGVELNPFESDIKDALYSKGIKTLSQFGVSCYRIDLVAMHPQKKGKPVLAIECDGASYHSSATARDRDRLRQEHLQRLGWRFHRIWSTDWFYSREQEINRAICAYNEAVRISDLEDINTKKTNMIDSSKKLVEILHKPSPTTRSPRPNIPKYSSINSYSIKELKQIADWVKSDGLLRTDEELVREIFNELPFRRLGSKIEERLYKAAGIRFTQQYLF